MPGANYMGGRRYVLENNRDPYLHHVSPTCRNAAKARLKDVTGRAQKGHFVKQRHQILVQGLQGDDRNVVQRSKGRVEDIDLAHAKRDFQHSNTARTTTILKKRPHNSLVPTTSSSDYEPNLRSSKVLKTLDIEDREFNVICFTEALRQYCLKAHSLRTTMDNLLKLPDFAGLSTSVKRRAAEAITRDQPTKKQVRPLQQHYDEHDIIFVLENHVCFSFGL